MGTGTGHLDRLKALVRDAAAAHRAVAVAQAAEARVFADAVELVLERQAALRAEGRLGESDIPLREVCAELATALRLSDAAVQRRLGDAASLRSGFPATTAAWERGEVDAGQVAAILNAGIPLTPEHRERYEQIVLDAARTEAAGRMRHITRVVAARIDPDGAAERVAERHAERRVRVIDLDDGFARLLADLPATLAYAIHDRLTRMATTARDGDGDGDAVDGPDAAATDREATPSPGAGGSVPADDAGDASGTTEHTPRPDNDREHDDVTTFVTDATRPARRGRLGTPPVTGRGDPRTLDQLRADVLADLLLAGGTIAHGDGLTAVTGHVQITVPVLTAAGTGTAPALLAGHGPIDPDTAKRLVGAASGWDRVLTHPSAGTVLDVDRYRPPEALKRLLRARDEHCRFPGCRRLARGADLDHTIDAALGGKTSVHNLAHLCRRHHTLKHHTAWTVRQRRGGVIEWRSPTGRTHHDRPPATVTFTPDTGTDTRTGTGTDTDTEPPPF
ncbi:HNH endonuclease signature motif containing protein [Microbacterium sp. GXF7504]